MMPGSFEYVGLGMSAIGALLVVVQFLLVRSVNRLDLTLDRIGERVDNHEQRVSRLEGFHQGRLQWEQREQRDPTR
jgi:hypothetical protein